MPYSAATARNVRYRRCSERQGGGEALVSEWFVSEVRPQPLAYPRLSTTLAL